MTAEEFARAYAERSGVTVEWLKANGREGRPCDCGWAACTGWQMAYVREDEWFEAKMRERAARPPATKEETA